MGAAPARTTTLGVIALVLSCVVLLGGSLVRAYPIISETFEARISVDFRRTGRPTAQGKGYWVNDQSSERASQWYAFDFGEEVGVHVVQRYDLGREYEINNATKECSVHSLIGDMPSVWDWLKSARSEGRREFHGKTCEVWVWKLMTMTFAACIEGTTPLVFAVERAQEDFDVFFFDSWRTAKPSDKFFEIPSLCKASSTQDEERMKVIRSGLQANRPVISEVFEARTAFEVRTPHDNIHGSGYWIFDQPDGKSRSFAELESGIRVDVLERHDLRKRFEVDTHSQACHIAAINETMPRIWDWVALAQYRGERDFHNHHCNLWEYHITNLRIAVCVSIADANRPIVVSIERSFNDFEVSEFHDFRTDKPRSEAFNIPRDCQTPAFERPIRRNLRKLFNRRA